MKKIARHFPPGTGFSVTSSAKNKILKTTELHADFTLDPSNAPAGSCGNLGSRLRRSAMKSNSFVHLIFPGVSAFAAALVLVSCAGHQDSAPQAPVAPGTLSSGAISTTGEGSFQGPVLTANGTAQAILTLDVWTRDGQRNAQVTLSPNGATSIIPLSADNVSFSVDIPSPQFKSNVNLTGVWDGTRWSGQLKSASNATNTFSLSPGARTAAALSIGAPTGTFDGVLTYRESKGKRGLSLTLTPSTNLGDALASTLTSRVSLKGVLKYSNGEVEPLINVVWDRENSTLQANGTVQQPGGPAVIVCKMSEMTSNNKDVLACAFKSAGKNAPVATGPLSQKRTVVAPPYPTLAATPYPGPPVQPNPIPQPNPPAPTPYVPAPPAPTPAPTAAPIPAPTAIPVPVPTPGSFQKNIRNFDGTGVFASKTGKKQTRDLTLSLTLIEDPTGSAQKANVKFVIDGSRVGANFIEGTYNIATQSLSASQVMTLGVLAGADLECRGLDVSTLTYDFVCHYESYATNVSGDFHLKGVFK